MSNREQLFEKYEDALFALLMDDLAEVEGERLLELNEELKADPDAAVPIDVQQRCIAVINREFAKKKRTASRQRAKKVLKILPWAVVIAMALMAVAMAAFPSFRTGVLNIFTSDAVDHESWIISGEKNSIPSDSINGLSFSTSVPSNFAVEDISKSDYNERVFYRDTSDPNVFFTILVSKSDNVSINIDTENVSIENEIVIQGYTAKIIKKDNSIRLFWANPDIACTLVIEGEGLSASQIESIARSMVFH